jgi:hypothetical protein
MATQRHAPRSKSRTVGSQPAAQQSSPQSMANHDAPADTQRDRLRDAMANQGAQGRHVPFSLKEEEDDDAATRH